MDCFYAAVEILERPELRDLPVAVGGHGDRRGVLTTCNYPARKFGVRSAMPTSQALKLCPDLVLLPVRMDLYKEKSRQVFEIFRSYTDLVEAISLDEAYLDVSDCAECGGSATLIAEEIRLKIFQTTGLTASAGVATNKFLAKVSSDINKPNGIFVLTPGSELAFLKDLPVSKIWGVGKKLNAKLESLNIRTCGELKQWKLADLEQKLGSMGHSLYQYARGVDERPVISSRKRKSLSVERTFSEDYPREKIPQDLISDLFGALLIRLSKFQSQQKSKGLPEVKISALVVKVKFSDFQQVTREQKWHIQDKVIFKQLLSKALLAHNKGVRLIGLGVKFDSISSSQIDLFSSI